MHVSLPAQATPVARRILLLQVETRQKNLMKSGARKRNRCWSVWAENVNYLESKDARKVWERIAPELSAKCGTKKTNDKCQQTMKYWIDRYKAAKIWIRNQSGGNRKQSIFYKEINEVLGCRDGIWHSVTLLMLVPALVLMLLCNHTMKRGSLKTKTKKSEKNPKENEQEESKRRSKKWRGEGNV